MTTIRILRQGQELASASGERAASLLYRGTYQPGDEIRFEAGYSRARVTVDQAVAPARVFIENGGFTYRVPIGGDSGTDSADGTDVDTDSEGGRDLADVKDSEGGSDPADVKDSADIKDSGTDSANDTDNGNLI